MSLYSLLGSILASGNQATTLFQTVTNANQITPIVPTPVVPNPTTDGGGGLKLNPFDWDWITSRPDPAMGIFAWGFFILTLVAFIGALYGMTGLKRRYRNGNPITYRQIDRWSQIIFWTSMAGLFFVLLRLPLWPTNTPGVNGSFEFGSARLWLYLMFIVYIVIAVLAYRYFTIKYPPLAAAWQAKQARRQYDPAVARRYGVTTTPKGSPTGIKRKARARR